ncbi:MAG: hypothetical protein M3M85_03685 [bacterium]|nr:hypothetical protein [bacterium]
MRHSIELSIVGPKGGDRKERLEQFLRKLQDPLYLPEFQEAQAHLTDSAEIAGNISTWHKFFDTHHIHEIWTKEYMRAFGNYLARRTKELGGTEKKPVVILEAGAGDGRLTHFLEEEMGKIIPRKFKLFACDSGETETPIPHKFPVEAISHREALQKYKPQIVIFSWMPMGYDCTDDFRATSSVQEYILIGQSGSGSNCGDDWKTWGIRNSNENLKIHILPNEPTPYETDGFEYIYQGDLSELQLDRMNVETGGRSTSSTISFKRKK